MAKTLSTTLQAETAKRVTTPGYLVQIGFSTILYYSTRGTQTWNGLTWTGGRLGKVQVGGSGTVELINTDLLIGALVLNEGIADRPIRVWAFYGDNPGINDVSEVFAGVGDSCEVGDDRVRIKLVTENRNTMSSPRRFINAAAGFNRLLPAKSRVTWGEETYVIERAN